MGKNRNIDVVRKLGKWDEKKKKKKGRHVWVREILRWEKKMGIEMGKREEINEKKIASISEIFSLLNYSPLLHQQNLMWNKDLTYYNSIVQCEIKDYLLQQYISM